ncbi:MAG: phosphoribosylformylglycinamidine cyclo-ligase [Dethiosulfovibrio peptidovorans]|nr:MAG: phosphoribosylformylglycinamidine cyclo-ligase [Dethiosulfovibrio peptidovorans]
MKNWTYEESGVSIDGGNRWVQDIGRMLLNEPIDPCVVGGIGGFNGLYDLGEGRLLAACCDGVGTKLEIATSAGVVRGLGQDLVAMSVNDLITCGARPLFFLDYLACGRLDSQRLFPVIQGVAEACRLSGCVLLGGETAEMPGTYPPQGFDLAGFAVGLVNQRNLVDGSTVTRGDVLVGLPSSGIHSNGYSLVRSALADELTGDLHHPVPELGEALATALLRPTRLYPDAAAAALSSGAVKAMAHITGGGLEENIARSLPEGLSPMIDYGSWDRPPIFTYISDRGVAEDEMRRVFNLGIGFVLTTGKENLNRLVSTLNETGEEAIIMGTVA